MLTSLLSYLLSGQMTQPREGGPVGAVQRSATTEGTGVPPPASRQVPQPQTAPTTSARPSSPAVLVAPSILAPATAPMRPAVSSASGGTPKATEPPPSAPSSASAPAIHRPSVPTVSASEGGGEGQRPVTPAAPQPSAPAAPPTSTAVGTAVARLASDGPPANTAVTQPAPSPGLAAREAVGTPGPASGTAPAGIVSDAPELTLPGVSAIPAAAPGQLARTDADAASLPPRLPFMTRARGTTAAVQPPKKGHADAPTAPPAAAADGESIQTARDQNAPEPATRLGAPASDDAAAAPAPESAIGTLNIPASAQSPAVRWFWLRVESDGAAVSNQSGGSDVRFFAEATVDRFGSITFDGLVRRQRRTLDLTVHSDREFGPAERHEIGRRLQEGLDLAGYTGGIVFRHGTCLPGLDAAAVHDRPIDAPRLGFGIVV